MFRFFVKSFIALCFTLVISGFCFMGWVFYKGSQLDYSHGLKGAFEEVMYGKKPSQPSSNTNQIPES